MALYKPPKPPPGDAPFAALRFGFQRPGHLVERMEIGALPGRAAQDFSSFGGALIFVSLFFWGGPDQKSFFCLIV